MASRDDRLVGQRVRGKRHGRRLRSWRKPHSLFSEIRSFQLADPGPLALFSAYAYFARDIPPVDSVLNRPVPQTTEIYDRNGTLLAELIDPNYGRRILVNLDQLPPNLTNATIAIEDPTFYSNPGIDP